MTRACSPADSSGKLLQLVYASAATYEFSSSQLEALLFNARRNNTRLGVSGILLHKDNSFLQVLEGDPDTVRALYDKIAADARHGKIKILSEAFRDERSFEEWNMGFVNLNEYAVELEGFVKFLQHDEKIELEANSKGLQEMLNQFRTGAWRQALDGKPVELV